MKDLFVPFELAVKLRDKGFKKDPYYNVFGVYDAAQGDELILNRDNDWIRSANSGNRLLPAPLWQQAIDWLREKEINIEVHYYGGYGVDLYGFIIITKEHKTIHTKESLEKPKPYKESLKSVIEKALEII